MATPPGSTSPILFEQWCGFFYVQQEQISKIAVRRDLQFFVLIQVNWKVSVTICRCHYKGSTLFSVILRTWVLIRPGLEPATSRSADQRTPWANQATVANYCALAWWGGLYALTTLETIPLGSLSLVGSTMLCRFWVKGQMNCNAWPSRLRTRHWLMSHPRKKISLLKPDTFFKIAEALKCADIMRNGCSKRRGKEVTALFIVF